MKIKIIIIIIFSICWCFFYSSPLYSAAKNNPKKNKPLSVLLSVVSPGMGQMYEGQLGTGLAIWSASTVLSFSFFLVVGEIDLLSTWNPTTRFRLKQNLTSDELFWAMGIGATYALLYIYNVIDVATYNDENNVSINIHSNSISLNYTMSY